AHHAVGSIGGRKQFNPNVENRVDLQRIKRGAIDRVTRRAAGIDPDPVERVAFRKIDVLIGIVDRLDHRTEYWQPRHERATKALLQHQPAGQWTVSVGRLPPRARTAL